MTPQRRPPTIRASLSGGGAGEVMTQETAFIKLGCFSELVSHYFIEKALGATRLLPKPVIRFTMKAISHQDYSGGSTP